ncbi:hypothetical protein P879_03841 [Paragonimus westermani]|uniref:Uncharacterized protein n=1 Tax=Paragonimus westermani TaxID=34504 RepID=A0A8T0DEP5_9TREM|nr:hypothetical protein P879_03841 [Paragonimus westermani]
MPSGNTRMNKLTSIRWIFLTYLLVTWMQKNRAIPIKTAKEGKQQIQEKTQEQIEKIRWKKNMGTVEEEKQRNQSAGQQEKSAEREEQEEKLNGKYRGRRDGKKEERAHADERLTTNREDVTPEEDNTSPSTEDGAEENSQSSESVETVSPEVTDEITPAPEPDGETDDGTDESETVITEPDVASSTEDNTSPSTEDGAEENSQSSESVETVSPEVTDEFNRAPIRVSTPGFPTLLSTATPFEPSPTYLNSPESTELAEHEVTRFDDREEPDNTKTIASTDRIMDIHNSTDVSEADRLLNIPIPTEDGTSEKSSATIHRGFVRKLFPNKQLSLLT